MSSMTPDIPAFLAAVRQDRPRVTVLCGSTRFSAAFATANLTETLTGRIVLSIGCDMRADADLFADLSKDDLTDVKTGLDALHRHKIDLADDVLVLNVGGYIGESTRAEVTYARSLGKPIRFLEPVCDNTSVAVIITDPGGKVLVFERATFPAGVACAAGHIDEHGDARDAAIAETREELGLTVTSLQDVTGGWRPNRCCRHPGERGVGHQWTVYQAVASGDLDPSERETRNARWVTRDELQALADRTVAYAHSRVTAVAFEASPGLEPVQVQWFVDAALITVTEADLAAIDQLAAWPAT
jgi:8-oxo-dGTP pyrophosphatase MutT (NUDIX family)